MMHNMTRKCLKTWLQVGLRNWLTLLYFEIFYKVTGITLLTILADGTPLTSLAAVVLFVYYVYFEITALIIYSEYGWRDEQLSVFSLFKETLFHFRNLLRIKNLPVLLLLLPLIALSSFPLTSGLLNKFKIPEFVIDFLKESPVLFTVFLVALLAVNILLFFYLFRFPGVVLHGEYFLTRCPAQEQFLRGRKLETAKYLILVFLTCILILFAGFICMCLLLWFLSKWPASVDGGRAMFQFYYSKWSVMGAIVVDIFASQALFSIVVTLYHLYKKDVRPVRTEVKWSSRAVLLRMAAVFFMFGLLSFYSETEIGGNLYSAVYDTKIVAHRAGAAFAPENTLSALENTIKDKVELAEIDVQQTRDGVLIVMHDSNFKRTTGLNQKVWDTDYKTVRTLDAGSHFSSAFAGEKIPTLKEMLSAAKGRIHLMIELKATGHEEKLVEKTVEEVKAAGMSGQCTVASMDLELLRQSKELAPDIDTVYITTYLKSNLSELDYVDGYSVETTFLSARIVAEAHSRGKKVYGWTANTERNMKKILRLGTDGLVTDNPKYGQFTSENAEKDYTLDFITELLYPDRQKG